MRGVRATIVLLGAALAFAALVVAGCGGGEATKAGGSGGPITLRIGTADSPVRPMTDQVEEFARQVAELSGGQIRIEPVWDPDGGDVREWDQHVARMVVRGELDLGMVPARAWDTEGVTSLRALNAPFLVTSDELLDRVVASELATEMLAGLEGTSVVGLALLPESLRHAFGFGAPLLSPEDYAGALVRAPRSDVAYALFDALGATPDDVNGSEFDQAIADGSVAAMESSFQLASERPPGTLIAAGNVPLFAKANVLVVNQDVLAGLTGEQRRILEEAAAATLRWAIDSRPSTAAAADGYCNKGGSIVLASDADLAALEGAAAPVYAELEQDPQTRSLIERIRELKSQVPASTSAVPAACGQQDAAEASAAETGAADNPSILNGIYRNELSYDYLIDNGLDEQTARIDSGIWTTTLEDGAFVWRSDNPEISEDMTGTYLVEGNRLTFICATGCDWTTTMTYELTDEGLSFSDVRLLPPHDEPDFQRIAEVEWALPVKRIG